MTLVVVERVFETPTSVDALNAREQAGSWCLDMHRVRFLWTYVAKDGLRMACMYEAPDAEAVRIAQRTIDMPVERVWAAASIPATTPELTGVTDVVVVERQLSQPIDAAMMSQMRVGAGWCMEMYRVRGLHSFLSSDGTRALCTFAAPDAESVRNANRKAELDVQLAWPGTLHMA